MTASGRTDAAEPPLPTQVGDLFFDRPLCDLKPFCDYSCRQVGFGLQEFKDFLRTFLRTLLFLSVNRDGKEATVPVVGKVDLGPVFECPLDTGAKAAVR